MSSARFASIVTVVAVLALAALAPSAGAQGCPDWPSGGAMARPAAFTEGPAAPAAPDTFRELLPRFGYVPLAMIAYRWVVRTDAATVVRGRPAYLIRSTRRTRR